MNSAAMKREEAVIFPTQESGVSGVREFPSFPVSQPCLGHKRAPQAATSDSHAGRHARRAESGSPYQFYAPELSGRNAILDSQRANAGAWFSHYDGRSNPQRDADDAAWLIRTLAEWRAAAGEGE